jgi:hypothetical protein
MNHGSPSARGSGVRRRRQIFSRAVCGGVLVVARSWGKRGERGKERVRDLLVSRSGKKPGSGRELVNPPAKSRRQFRVGSVEGTSPTAWAHESVRRARASERNASD